MILAGVVAEEKTGGGGGGAIVAPVVVQHAFGFGAGFASATLPSPATAGHTIVVALEGWQSTAPVLTVSDDQGNSYSLVSGPDTNPAEIGGTFRYLFVCPAAVGTPQVFSAASGASGHYWLMAVVEVSGCDPSPVDTFLPGTPCTGTNWSAGSMTTTQDNDLLLAFPGYADFSGATVISAGASWTLLGQLADTTNVGMRTSSESQTAATAGSYAVEATLASSTSGAIIAVALKGH